MEINLIQLIQRSCICTNSLMLSVCGYCFTKNVSYEIVCLLDVLLSCTCKHNDIEFQKGCQVKLS